jgi:hypothetical protein
MRRDGSDSARARSARIRASHDYEATHLDSMRRNTLEQPEPKPHSLLVTRVVAAFTHLRGSHPSSAQAVTRESEAEAPAGVVLGD